MAHARLSPSSAERWMTCPGSVSLSDGVEDPGSDAAAEGTAAHELAERILLGQGGPIGAGLVGQKAENGIEWTEDMRFGVMAYVQAIRDIVAQGDPLLTELLIEQKLDISGITGEGKWVDELTGEQVAEGVEGAVWKPAHGTSDAVIMLHTETLVELVVADLKFGRGVVVDAEQNRQLMIYALAAYLKFKDTHGPFGRVRLVISQPRLNALSEWSCSIEELLAFGEEVAQSAKLIDVVTQVHHTLGEQALVKYLHPSEKACKFCKVKGACPKLASDVLDMFDTVDPRADVVATCSTEEAVAEERGQSVVRVVQLSSAMKMLPLVEAWIKGVRARVESELLAGRNVPGYKLVQGRQGPRKWGDTTDAAAMLKAFKLKTEEMYDLSLISPTTAETLAKAKTIGPRQWTKLQALITRAEGGTSVAPEDDKRPAIQVAAVTDDFDAIEDPPSVQALETVDDLL